MSSAVAKPWDHITELMRRDASPEEVETLLDSMEPDELLHAVYLLTPDDQRALLSMLRPERSAALLEILSDAHAADLIEEMPAQDAAPIVEELASDHRVDVLAELGGDSAEAIIAELDEEDADEIRELINYPPDQAGGLMMTEFASYPRAMSVRTVIEDLTRDDIDYHLLTVHYVYVVVSKRKLVGIIRIRDLVFADPERKIGELVKAPLTIPPDATLEDMENFFDEHDIAAVPVVDHRGLMLGLVRRRSLLQALADRAESDSLKVAGIIGGDELRSMPVLTRSWRRLSWLSINIVLNILAASVIAFYEDTLDRGHRPRRVPSNRLGHEWLLRQPGGRRQHA